MKYRVITNFLVFLFISGLGSQYYDLVKAILTFINNTKVKFMKLNY